MKEEWRDIDGYKGRFQVSNKGRVKRLRYRDQRPSKSCVWPEMIRKPFVNPYGYVIVTIRDGIGPSSKTFSMHKLVMNAFIGPCPKGMERNHINGIKTDNRVENLEYCTRQQNVRHAWDVLGRKHYKGEENPRSKLTDKKVIRIRKLFATGRYYQMDLARMFNIGHSSIWYIVTNQTWKHLLP